MFSDAREQMIFGEQVSFGKLEGQHHHRSSGCGGAMVRWRLAGSALPGCRAAGSDLGSGLKRTRMGVHTSLVPPLRKDPMFRTDRLLWLAAVVGLLSATTRPPSFAQEPSDTPATSANPATAEREQEVSPLPDLTIAPDADSEALTALIAKAKAIQPQSAEQFKAMQVAIRDASRKQLGLLEGKEKTPAYQQAEIDMITASVSLMTFFSDKEQAATVAQVHSFLKGRQPLSMQDVQTGMLTAAMLELQPNKRPSRDTYELLDELLKEDEREEMQNLRINLRAAVRRLNLLGNKFDLEARAIDGTPIKIQDHAGKFVIIDFFATWCEPCLSEIPRLAKHYEKYREKGLDVIGISLDGDADALQEFLDREQLPWPIIHDNAEEVEQRIQMKFGVSSLPTVLLLNKEGTVVSLEARGGELDRLMEMLFESPTPAAPPIEAPEVQPAADPAAAGAADGIKPE